MREMQKQRQKQKQKQKAKAAKAKAEAKAKAKKRFPNTKMIYNSQKKTTRKIDLIIKCAAKVPAMI